MYAKILNVMRNGFTWLDLEDIMLMAECSENTATRCLDHMIAKGLVHTGGNDIDGIFYALTPEGRKVPDDQAT